MSQLPLFVFGTLRSGHENHHYLAGRFDRMLSAKLADFRRSVAAHGYPAVVPSPGDAVEGELYFLRPELYDDTLVHCDRLEDLPPGQLVGEYYQRATVTVETTTGTHTAWAYISPP